MIKTIKNPEQHIAKVGDIYIFTYDLISVPFISNAHRKIIVDQVNKDTRFKVVNSDSNGGELSITVEIVKNPFPLIVGASIISGAIALTGLFAWLSLSKVEQVFSTPSAKISGLAISIGLLLGALTLSGILRK